MKTARVRSRCECQGRLEAIVDEKGTVLSGCVTARGGGTELAPATAISAGAEIFQVGWLCPLCHRNTLRSFYRGALVYQDSMLAQTA